MFAFHESGETVEQMQNYKLFNTDWLHTGGFSLLNCKLLVLTLNDSYFS